MNISELSSGRFIRQEDIDDEVVVTIVGVQKEDIATSGQAPKIRGVISFREHDKRMVLNKTNVDRLGKLFGNDVDAWAGRKVTLYVDPDVEFGGKTIGGLRLKAYKPKARPRLEDLEDDVPFPLARQA